MEASKGPLSWEEARSLLRELLVDYLDRPPVIKRASDDASLPDEQESLLSKWIRHDLDLYAGALFLSIALLVLASLSLSARMEGVGESLLDPQAALLIYRTELAAAVMLVLASLLGVWVVRRRRFLCLNDSDNAKRREIRKFLRARMEDDEEALSRAQNESSKSSAPVQLTAQTEVFPVYRQHGNVASWSKIPSLLCVKNDWIALQIGDIAPAQCYARISMDGENAPTKIIHIAAGERLSMETLGYTAEQLTANLPRGRTTLSPDSSDNLLTLCNKMQIFTLIDTPLAASLNRPSVVPKSSQISRQVKAIREALSVFAVFVFVITAIIAFSRLDTESGDITLIAHLPILAALGVLPVVGPAFIFFVEVLGTARVLTSAHPYSSSTTDVKDGSGALLLLRYILASALSRLSFWHAFDTVNRCVRHLTGSPRPRRSKLVRVPPASVHLLEKLGVVTAFTLVDDELACEPQSVPQQLLIPSAKGLKLLDLCPVHEGGESDGESDSEAGPLRKQRGKSFDSDSESEDGTQNFHTAIRRKVLPRRMRRPRSRLRVRPDDEAEGQEASRFDVHFEGQEASRFDVQFEEPNWWQYLPSLKCIGLGCLLVDETQTSESSGGVDSNEDFLASAALPVYDKDSASAALSKLVCSKHRSKQLRSLAECIGFSTEENSFGKRGDISTFTERLRLRLISTHLFKERLALDAHERSSEQSRWWGLLRPDMTSVIVQDSRTKAFQLLSVGDPRSVCNFCNEAWQGEISTILPLAAVDRKTIIETTNNWKLADLDVAAFSYTPVPHTLETRLTANRGSHVYLLDHSDHSMSLAKDKSVSSEWSFIGNQIFLGVLGSLVVPRREIQKLLGVLSDAGVRFVYFSPRNMRRQKELAIQMGIDVAWNCAISLRPLESGEEDPHRMVSNYADWDVNAKLPHGVRDVRKHLEEVDNVPLLVSLFTDATKTTTKEMVEIFQEYNDTVISVGLSHLTRNEGIFASADIAVGIDILEETCDGRSPYESSSSGHVFTSELEFVQSISAHACAFRFRGASSVSHISTIIEKSRASLDAAVAATIFLITGCLSFSLYVLFSVCAPSTSMPFVPTLGCTLYLLVLLPGVGLAMAMSDGSDKETMKRVPPKNDRTITFARNERSTFYLFVVSKAFLPALLPQVLHLIVFGELVIQFEPSLVATKCPGAHNWVDIVRCGGMKDYSGNTKTSAGSLVFAQFVLCMLVASAGFVHRFVSLKEQKPWDRNIAWLCSVFISFGLLVIYVVFTTDAGTAAALPWYYFLIASTSPFLSLLWIELIKQPETKQERRAEKLRRLQFETRLGAWSPR